MSNQLARLATEQSISILPEWMQGELCAWMLQRKTGSLTFHAQGGNFVKIERHEWVKAPTE